MAVWKAMRRDDLPAVMRIAGIVHVDYPEREEVFAERLHLFPDGCRIAFADGRAVGYGVMHPAVNRRPPALDSLLGALPADADVLYLHDIALLPEARGLRLGEAVLAYAENLARITSLATLALTSTPGARSYWLGRGFTPVDDDTYLAAKLASYGEGMAYMTRTS